MWAAQRAKGEFPMTIIIREWEPRIAPLLEMRCVVHGGRLVTVSQYVSMFFVPQLAVHREGLRRAVEAYWEKEVRPLVPSLASDNFIIDLLCVPPPGDEPGAEAKAAAGTAGSAAGWYIRMIELNPYECSTGMCLFSWRTESGVAALSGRTPAAAAAATLQLMGTQVEVAAQLAQGTWDDRAAAAAADAAESGDAGSGLTRADVARYLRVDRSGHSFELRLVRRRLQVGQVRAATGQYLWKYVLPVLAEGGVAEPPSPPTK